MEYWENRIKEKSFIGDDDVVNMEIILDGNSISHLGIREREILIFGCKMKIGSIGGVETKPEYRNRGLATRLMESSIRRLYDDGGDVMFVSGDRGLYRRLGCVDAGEVVSFLVHRNKKSSFQEQKVEISPYQEGDILKLVSIYQKEPVRFYRPLENFKRNLKREPVPLWIEPDVILLHKNGESVGYLVVQESKKKEGREPGHGFISEYVGDRRAIFSAIGFLFDMYDFNDLRLWAPWYDTELIRIFEVINIEGRRQNIPGHTFKIINFPQLMGKLRPYIRERVDSETVDSISFEQKGGTFSIKLGGEKFFVDGSLLVPIIFGTYDNREKEMMPKEGKIAEVLETLFPIPFIWPGLDSF